MSFSCNYLFWRKSSKERAFVSVYRNPERTSATFTFSCPSHEASCFLPPKKQGADARWPAYSQEVAPTYGDSSGSVRRRKRSLPLPDRYGRALPAAGS